MVFVMIMLIQAVSLGVNLAPHYAGSSNHILNSITEALTEDEIIVGGYTW